MTPALDLPGLAGAPDDAPAVVTPAGERLSYQELRQRVARCRAALAWPGKALVVVDAPRTVPGFVGYLAALSAGHAVTLVEDGSAELGDWLAGFRPELLVGPAGGRLAGLAGRSGFRRRGVAGAEVWCHAGGTAGPAIHPDLGMLARTSGSLGPPKLIRLSFDNLRANATAIAAALGLRGDDRAMASLPLDYSFGLSLVNSALAAGASITLTTESPSGSPLWRQLDLLRGTIVGAVPSSYRFLRARRWDPAAHPSLRLLLCAGGRLDEADRAYHAARMAAAGGSFVPMYGQTEATARIAYLSPDLAASHPGAAGIPVPGTDITVDASGDEIGEIIVRGPGVMMGYARTRDDLAAGDLRRGVLRTGDLGYLRGQVLYLTGRADRQVKVFGRRVDLDQIERSLRDERGLDAAVEATGDQLHVVVAGSEPGEDPERACRQLARRLGLPASAVRLRPVAALPQTRHRKVDRRAVRRHLVGSARSGREQVEA